MSATITVTGLGSGIDLSQIVDQLVQLERYQINRLEIWKDEWEDKIESIQGLNSRLLSLESFANDYNTETEFLATTATSSDEDVLTVTSTSTATPGAHTVTVGSDTPHRLASQGWADENITGIGDLGSGENGGGFVITVGSQGTITIANGDINAATTLQGLRDLINNDGDNTGLKSVTASIIDDGSDNDEYRLVITADNGGPDYEISITENPTDLSFSTNWINPAVHDDSIIWDGSSQATSSGYYLGSGDKTYTFTVPEVNLNGANSAALVPWTKTGGGSGSLVIPANYTAGTAIAVDGLVDDAEHSSSWSGASEASSGGNYTGSFDKFYTFTVPDGTVGTGDLTVNWSEAATGRSGTITIPDLYAPGTDINVDGVNSVEDGSGWTGTSQATSSGNYTDTTNQIYTFTVASVDGGSGTGTVGTNTINIDWQNTDNSTSGTIIIDGAYTAGDAVNVENGLKVSFSAGTLITDAGNDFIVETEQGPEVSFSAGTLVNGQTFSIDVRTALEVSFSAGTLVNTDKFYVNTVSNVDSAETGTWSGPSITSAGHYLGTSNKTFSFSVLNSGTLGDVELGISWSDREGNSGAITIPDNYTAGTNLDVSQGLKISFAAGDLVSGDDFSIDVYSPHLQKGQSTGLAQVEQVVHSGFADTGTTAVTDEDRIFSYTYGGVTIDVDVAADTTLSGLVALINNDTDNPGVTASVLNDGLGLNTSYHLVLAGTDTGASYAITNIKDTFTGGTFSSDDFTTTQEAQNSMLKVDGYPSDTYQYIQRQSNSVSDVIDGVTLSLVDSGSASVSITKDLDTIRTNIETFVNGVNFLLDYIKKETGYDEDTGEAGAMVGNYSYQIVQARINQILTNAIPGLTDGVDTYVHLAQIGIKTNPDEDGKWEIDSTTLNNALLTDLEAISKLFIKDDVAGTNGVYELLSQELEDLTDSEDGPMNVLVEHYEDIIDGIDTRVEREERRIALVEGRLTDQFVALEVLLGQLSGQESYLLSLIESLPTIGGKKD